MKGFTKFRHLAECFSLNGLSFPGRGFHGVAIRSCFFAWPRSETALAAASLRCFFGKLAGAALHLIYFSKLER